MRLQHNAALHGREHVVRIGTCDGVDQDPAPWWMPWGAHVRRGVVADECVRVRASACECVRILGCPECAGKRALARPPCWLVERVGAHKRRGAGGCVRCVELIAEHQCQPRAAWVQLPQSPQQTAVGHFGAIGHLNGRQARVGRHRLHDQVAREVASDLAAERDVNDLSGHEWLQDCGQRGTPAARQRSRRHPSSADGRHTPGRAALHAHACPWHAHVCMHACTLAGAGHCKERQCGAYGILPC